MDVLNASFSLGRFHGTQIRVSFLHLIMLAYLSMSAQQQGILGMAILGLVYFLSILLHEIGHAIACKAVGGVADLIVLGPMGGLTMAHPPDRPLPHFITTAGGPAVNVILLALCWGITQIPALEPFLYGDSIGGVALEMFLHYMIFINEILLLLNLLPIYPMDGGRLLQNILWPLAGYRNSILVTGMIGTVGGGALLALGIGITTFRVPIIDYEVGGGFDYFLLTIGLSCMMASWGLYQRAREIQGWRKN